MNARPLAPFRPSRTIAARTAGPTLPRLYLARFAFAVVWAALLATSASGLGAFTVTLLVLYPAVDVVAALVDARATQRRRSSAVLYTNVGISTLAAAGLGVAAAAGTVPDVARVWGVWAIAAGLTQLIVALGRRDLGGHVAMIVSGGLSTVVGVTFVAGAAHATSLTNVAGYAALGGVFFLVSALRLRHSSRTSTDVRFI